MAEALSCCDIAYFPTGCSLADKSNVTGVGNYMAHCDYYPVTREKDTIAERLLSTQVVRLKEALQNLSTYAQAECRASANEFLSSVADLNSSTYRITLLTAFRRGMSSINPLWCTDAGTASMETFLRQRWGQRKPIFGLEDVSVECQAFQGNTVAEDQELATFMIDHFNEPWLSQMAKYQENMEQVMKCGDLDVLTTVAEGIKDLPLSSERNLQYRNNNLAWGVQKAMDANQDKNIFFAIPVTHLVDVAGRTGVLSQLTKAGLNPVRQTPAVAAAERCQASTYEAPGAAALDHCLKPPAQSQPLSCIQFEKQFEQILGKDLMHGRVVTPGPNCGPCVSNSTTTCTCEMKWSNYENFENLCKSTQVDGFHGQVYYLDMIRNPGSTREGLHLAEKTVGGLYQRCYASSCEIPIIQEMATRNWYKTDKSLDVGSVTVRKVDQPFGFVPNVGGSSFAWWPWVLLTLLILGCILCLGRLFFMPKMTPKRIGSVKKTGWDPNYDLGMKGDSETEPLKVPMNAHRDPYDRRDVQNLGTLPTGTDIQMPDMSKYPGQSSFNASFPRAPPPPPMAYPAPHIPAQPSVAPPVTAAPVTYQSLQGYQGSMPMPMTPQLVSPPAPSYPMGDGSLLALSGQLASQLENSGAEAIRSLRLAQPAPAPQPLATPCYQPMQPQGTQFVRR